MNDVPRWQAKFIAEWYYETYHYLYPDVPHFSQLDNEQLFTLVMNNATKALALFCVDKYRCAEAGIA